MYLNTVFKYNVFKYCPALYIYIYIYIYGPTQEKDNLLLHKLDRRKLRHIKVHLFFHIKIVCKVFDIEDVVIL